MSFFNFLSLDLDFLKNIVKEPRQMVIKDNVINDSWFIDSLKTDWYNLDFIIGIICISLFVFFLSLYFEENMYKIKVLHLLIYVYMIFLVYLNISNIDYINFNYNKDLLIVLWEDYIYAYDYFEFPDFNTNLYNKFICIFVTSILSFILLGFVDKSLMQQNKDFEFSWLIFLFFLTSIFLFVSTQWMEVFLCLECIGLCSYVLIGIERLKKLSATSGIRYLIMSALPSSIFILGNIYLYENYGTLVKDNIGIFLNSSIKLFIDLDIYNNIILFNDESVASQVLKNETYKLTNDWGSSEFCKNVFLKENINHNIFDWNLFELLFDSNIHLKTNTSNLSALYPSEYLNWFETMKSCKCADCIDWSNNSFVRNIERRADLFYFTDSIFKIPNLIFNSFDIFNLESLEVNKILLNKYFFISINLAIILIIINISFKITAAPFHIWAPVIYNNGSLASVTFLAIFSKLVLISFLIQIFTTVFYALKNIWSYIFLLIGILSIVFGMIGAFNEKFIKKFFIYSSMTDVGFMLLGFSFYTVDVYKYILNYLFIYNLSTILIWITLLYIKKKTKFLTNLQSILVSDSVLNLIFSLNVFSLAGIPPFGGFFIKLDILIYLVLSCNFLITFLILLITVFNFFYYLRLIKIIYFENYNMKKIYNKIDNYKLIIFSFIINIICCFEIYMQNSFVFIIEHIFKLSL